MFKVPLYKTQFSDSESVLIESGSLKVTGFKYRSGIEAIRIENEKGYLVILPFMGQMIWDACFLGVNLCMENMFTEPKPATEVVGTYGCFAFHSGLISNGCPGPEDTHPLHGEMPCAAMDCAWIECDEHSVSVHGEYEYVMGFGNHYLASPSVVLGQDSSTFDIGMTVKNLASVPMPLQYMCHMNTAYFSGAMMTQNIPDDAVKLRETIPAHVKPTKQWLDFNETLKSQTNPIESLTDPYMYDPEIVYFMDNLSQYTDEARFEMAIGDGKKLVTRFDTHQFNFATRWILYNGDQKVGAYVLPATCRPEGYHAALKNGTLIQLEPGEERRFNVSTGITR